MASDHPLDGRCGREVRNGDGYCENYPVDGASACRVHGGTGGAPEGNGNAITHGATADPVNLYRHLDADAQDWVDLLLEGYLAEAPFDEDSPKVERLQMTCVVIYQEWAAREAVLATGPSEDTTVGVTEAGTPIVRTDEHHLTDTAAKHNQTVRMNLKDLGLLNDPESQQADATESLATILSEAK